jgi:tetratricopeptide (TPR) repeat protein
MTSFVSSYRHKCALALIVAFAVAWIGCAGPTASRVNGGAGASPEKTASVPSSEVLDHVISASLFETQGDYLRALHEYYKALAYDSSQVDLYLAISEMHRNLEEYDHARLMLKRGVNAVGPVQQLLFPLGRLQYQAYEFDAARKTFEAYVKQDSTNSEALATLAALYERDGEPMKAAKLYERLLVLEPDSREIVLSRLGSLLTRAGQSERALKIYHELRSLRPDMHMVPFMIGSLKMDLGDTLSARDSFLEAAEMQPDEARYWDLSIRLSVILDDSATAFEALDSALVHNPDVVPLLSLASSAYARYDKSEKSVEILRHLTDIDSLSEEHFVNLGFMLHDLERWDEAAEAYDQAMLLAPDDPQVLNNYAYLLAESGQRLDEALEMVLTALDSVPDNASYVDTHGWILFKLGKHTEAAEVLLHARELDGNNPEILEHLGDVFQALGEMDRAREFWGAAIEKGGDEDTIREKMNL